MAATAAHAAFQLTVSVLVYPALADTPAERWEPVHSAHSRRITPLVALVYLAVLVACGGTLLDGPDAAAVAACVLSGAALLVTAALAAPLHGRLGRLGGRPDEAARVGLVRRLLLVDRVRTGCAVAGLVAALVAALSA